MKDTHSSEQMHLKLKASIDIEAFKNFYWLKKELIEFCRNNELLTAGSKDELTERIYCFLKTGRKEYHSRKQSNSKRDSATGLTVNTPVVNYKNDAATGEFFKLHIGKHFHFNAYLRQFSKETSIEKLTYGDLIKGWIDAESNKKGLNYKTTIGTQFKYNQFIRDFFTYEKEKTQQDAIKAWSLVKSKSGPCTYEHYKQIEAKICD